MCFQALVELCDENELRESESIAVASSAEKELRGQSILANSERVAHPALSAVGIFSKGGIPQILEWRKHDEEKDEGGH